MSGLGAMQSRAICLLALPEQRWAMFRAVKQGALQKSSPAAYA